MPFIMSTACPLSCMKRAFAVLASSPVVGSSRNNTLGL